MESLPRRTYSFIYVRFPNYRGEYDNSSKLYCYEVNNGLYDINYYRLGDMFQFLNLERVQAFVNEKGVIEEEKEVYGKVNPYGEKIVRIERKVQYTACTTKDIVDILGIGYWNEVISTSNAKRQSSFSNREKIDENLIMYGADGAGNFNNTWYFKSRPYHSFDELVEVIERYYNPPARSDLAIPTESLNIKELDFSYDPVLIIDNPQEKPIKIAYESDVKSYTVDKVAFYSINNKEEKSMGRTFNNLFDNIRFGKIDTNCLAYTVKGIAFRDAENKYNVYENNQAVDVTDFKIDMPIYGMPVAAKAIAAGDIISHLDEFVIVRAINDDGTVEAINPAFHNVVTILPQTNIFGFNYYTKIIDIFKNFGATANEANPFGNMLPLLMMADSSDNGMMKLIMLSQMGGNVDFNQMLPFMFMSEKSLGDKIDPFFIMMLTGENSPFRTAITSVLTSEKK